MNPRKRRKEELSVDSLELATLPPELDTALKEYFAHAPFDERLESLLDGAETKDFSLSFEGSTGIEILPGVFGHNVFHEDEETTEFELTLGELNDKDKTLYTFCLTSAKDEELSLRFDLNDKDSFDLINKKTGAITQMSSLEVAKMALRATGASDAPLQKLSESIGDSPSTYVEIVKRIWPKACEHSQGESESNKYIVLRGDESTDTQPVELRLGYKEIEDENSEIRFVIEKALLYPQFATEQVYRLELLYSSAKNHSAAKKVVRGDGGLLVRSIRAIHTELSGRETPLDLSSSENLKLFVDAYEEILGKVA